MEIQYYKTAKDNIGEPIQLQAAIDIISSNKLSPFVNNVRRNKAALESIIKQLENETDTEAIQQLKEKKKAYERTVADLKQALPAVTWSGTFEKRAKDKLIQHSGLICIDIDKLPENDLQPLREKLIADKYTFVLFISPSGNGLKVIVKSAGTITAHQQSFADLETYYQDTYKITIDTSGKDVSRLCFLSADTTLYQNNDSRFFSFEYKGEDAKQAKEFNVNIKLNKKEQTDFTSADNLDFVREFTDKKMMYVEGNRNNYIFLFACNANRKGFDINDTLNFCTGFATDLDTKELADTISKAFKYSASESGKYKKQTPIKKSKSNGTFTPLNRNTNDTNFPLDNGTVSNRRPAINKSNFQTTNFSVFWKEHTIEKGKGDNKFEVKQLQLLRVAFIRFLQEQGFFIIETGREGYQICHEVNGVIRPVDMRKIKNYVYAWCAAMQVSDYDTYLLVEEMLRKGQKNYFSYTDLESLKVKSPNFLKDTKDEAFFFFQNCYVKITAESITTHKISEVQAAIWDTSIIKKDFTIQDLNLEALTNESGYLDVSKTNSDIIKFVMQISTNPKKITDVTPEVAGERFLSICSAIGYMLHGYKDPIAKAVLAVDHKIPADKSEQNGGTGKSIIGKSFKYLKGVTELDGKDFKEDYQFRFEAIDIDTRIVVMADCKPGLDFASFFNAITSDFRYNKRHTGYITIPFEDAPKWWFDTNGVFKGEGSSYRRRQHIIEFDDFYSDEYTPLDYFGHLLFNDWDAEQWNLFFNFYFRCVQIYLSGGLLEYKQSNYDSRKLMVESNQEFIDWMDGYQETDDNGQRLINPGYRIKRNHWLVKKELLRMWNDEARSLNMNTISPHAFSKWVKKYCASKGYVFHSEKRNSCEYYMVAEKTFNPKKAVAPVTDLFSNNS